MFRAVHLAPPPSPPVASWRRSDTGQKACKTWGSPRWIRTSTQGAATRQSLPPHRWGIVDPRRCKPRRTHSWWYRTGRRSRDSGADRTQTGAHSSLHARRAQCRKRPPRVAEAQDGLQEALLVVHQRPDKLALLPGGWLGSARSPA